MSRTSENISESENRACALSTPVISPREVLSAHDLQRDSSPMLTPEHSGQADYSIIRSDVQRVVGVLGDIATQVQLLMDERNQRVPDRATPRAKHRKTPHKSDPPQRNIEMEEDMQEEQMWASMLLRSKQGTAKKPKDKQLSLKSKLRGLTLAMDASGGDPSSDPPSSSSCSSDSNSSSDKSFQASRDKKRQSMFEHQPSSRKPNHSILGAIHDGV